MAAVAFLLAGCASYVDLGPLPRTTQQQFNAAHGEYAVTPPPY
jgi:hypothetical protein